MAVSDASQSSSLLDSWNEHGQLLLAVGIATALVSWTYLPLAGLVSVYCGLGLWTGYDRAVAGGTIAGVGGLAVVVWVAFLVSLAL